VPAEGCALQEITPEKASKEEKMSKHRYVKGNDLADGGSGQDTCRTDLEDRRISC
jgi:hypothetical protein